MPFLTPLLVNNSKNFVEANKIVLPFTLGRIVSYISIAVIASSSTFLAKALINDTKTTQIVLGSFIILMSFYLLYRVYTNSCKCTSNSHLNHKPTSSIGSFFIGTLISLNPCVPVLSLVSFSASRSDVFEGFFYGLSFGIGAVITPYIFYTLLVSNILRGFIEAFKKYSKTIELLSISFLFLVGCLILSGKINL